MLEIVVIDRPYSEQCYTHYSGLVNSLMLFYFIRFNLLTRVVPQLVHTDIIHLPFKGLLYVLPLPTPRLHFSSHQFKVVAVHILAAAAAASHVPWRPYQRGGVKPDNSMSRLGIAIQCGCK